MPATRSMWADGRSMCRGFPRRTAQSMTPGGRIYTGPRCKPYAGQQHRGDCGTTGRKVVSRPGLEPGTPCLERRLSKARAPRSRSGPCRSPASGCSWRPAAPKLRDSPRSCDWWTTPAPSPQARPRRSGRDGHAPTQLSQAGVSGEHLHSRHHSGVNNPAAEGLTSRRPMLGFPEKTSVRL
jgi:hypothetical protein